MGCLVGLGRVLIVVINIIFLILGLVFLAAGMICLVGESILKPFYQSVLDSLESQLESNNYGTVDFSSFSLSSLIGGLGYFFVGLGLFLIIITIIGCCGACCKVKYMLVAYAIIVIAILAGEIIFVGILYGSPDTIKSEIKAPLKTTIQSDYVGFNGTNIVSLGWNFVHREFKCCGVDTYNDFTGGAKWNTNYGTGLKAPITCCETIPDATTPTCATTPVNIYTKGCFDEVYNMLLGNVGLVAGSIAGCGVFQLVLIIFALIIFCDARQSSKVNPNMWYVYFLMKHSIPHVWLKPW
ncbi:tetraspanin-1-like isoform X2 [Ostrea edulis]|uniref:tetraspanin-1-like isoform X2 n=2 Tax=Ostrea edulis TaxID=37623 RepID=UPI0024AFD454|nr:tetraspanin-1-like isoform X2 [Ostrea edulis]